MGTQQMYAPAAGVTYTQPQPIYSGGYVGGVTMAPQPVVYGGGYPIVMAPPPPPREDSSAVAIIVGIVLVVLICPGIFFLPFICLGTAAGCGCRC